MRGRGAGLRLAELLASPRGWRRGVRSFVGLKLAIAAAVVAVPALMLAGFFMAASSASTMTGSEEECRVVGSAGGAGGPPPRLIPIYAAASRKYRLGPRGPGILASINYHETSFGTNMNNTTGSGAMGWMMFMPETWATYGVDADGDGRKDPYDPEDAIYAAARYLRASGAPGNWHDAVFAYNHAEWYVQEVLKDAEKFGGEAVCAMGLGEVPTEAVARIEYVARWIESKRIHYCWGGGHGLRPGPSEGSGEFCPPGTKGLDCSGAVRWLLFLAGYQDPGGLASDDLGAHYPSGPGRAVTLWASPSHIFIEISGRTWGTSRSNSFNGPGFAEHTTIGFLPSHPQGL